MRIHLFLFVGLLSVCHANAQTPAPAAGQPAQGQAATQGGPDDRAEAAGAGIVPVRIGPVTLSGSAWVEGLKVDGDAGLGGRDEWRVRRARIGLAGNLAPKIGWNISGELTAERVLRNAFVVVQFSDQFNVRIGQATPPTGIERGTSPLTLELIDRSQVTNQLTYPLDPGITLMNAKPFKGWLGYAISVHNGAGLNRSDDNDAKDISGRLAVTPPAVEGLTIVGSGATGRQPGGRRTRAGLGVEYESRAFKALVEGLRQSTEGKPTAQGYVMMGVYRIRPAMITPHFRMLELAGRLVILDDRAAAEGTRDVVDTDDGGGGGAPPAGISPVTTRSLQFGGNYYVNANVRLMGNVLVPVDDRANIGTTFITRLQIVF